MLIRCFKMQSQHLAAAELHIVECGLQDFCPAQVTVFKYTISEINAGQICPLQIAVRETAAFKITGWEQVDFIKLMISIQLHIRIIKLQFTDNAVLYPLYNFTPPAPHQLHASVKND